MIFRAEHSSTQYIEPPHVVIHTPDTDVVIPALAFHKFSNSPLFIKIGNKDKARIINIVEVLKNVQTRMKEEISSDNMVETILGLDVFTGCDSQFLRRKKQTERTQCYAKIGNIYHNIYITMYLLTVKRVFDETVRKMYL